MEKAKMMVGNEPWMQITEIKITFRNKIRVCDRPRVSSSQEAFRLLKGVWNLSTIELREEAKVLFLNQDNRVLGKMDISIGSIDHVTLDIRLVLAAALKAAATSLIIAHNHPSGCLKPSPADRKVTERLKDACELLTIKLLDHLILAGDGERFYSMADNGDLKRPVVQSAPG